MSGSFAGTLCMFCATVGSIKTLSVVVNRISYGGTATKNIKNMIKKYRKELK